ncbi:hypothetical protein D3C84_1214870 [compost metagenome]
MVHKKVALGVLDDPDNCMEVTKHVNALSSPALTFGSSLSSITVTVFLAKQPSKLVKA